MTLKLLYSEFRDVAKADVQNENQLLYLATFARTISTLKEVLLNCEVHSPRSATANPRCCSYTIGPSALREHASACRRCLQLVRDKRLSTGDPVFSCHNAADVYGPSHPRALNPLSLRCCFFTPPRLLQLNLRISPLKSNFRLSDLGKTHRRLHGYVCN
jgi:hypothetical protein